MLNTIESIKTRYSCRAFSGKSPSDEELQVIAKSAVSSPSAMNSQLWRVIVVKNKELLDELESEAMKNIAALPDKGAYERIMSRGGKLYYNAPCHIVIPILKSEHWAELDCGIITQTVALAAASLGIDSLICGLAAFSFSGEKRDYFERKLGFPQGYELGISVLLGYAEKPDGSPHEPDYGKISVIE
jgi:nitroreductase